MLRLVLFTIQDGGLRQITMSRPVHLALMVASRTLSGPRDASLRERMSRGQADLTSLG